MLPEGSVHAEHVWKRFRADKRRPQFRDRLQQARTRILGGRPGWTWALRDVNLTADPGEAVGLVGINGSGKSTFLKIITGVMYPYAGRVEVSGRIGALIEVSAGLHPQLTGRENAFLYGSLLGLSRREVTARFDEIVGFAELETAVDRQVKFYSSGMKMRLGFSVAAFLEPDVLIVDEVLAVGDASFQHKCLERMNEVLMSGTTLLFVSHDLASVRATCTRGIWLHDGVMKGEGPIEHVLDSYRGSIEEAAEAAHTEGDFSLREVVVSGQNNEAPRSHEPVEIGMVIESEGTRSVAVHLGITEGTASPIFTIRRDVILEDGNNELVCTIRDLPLPRGRFYLWAAIRDPGRRTASMQWRPVSHFDLSGPDLDDPPRAIVRLAPIHVDTRWNR